MRSTAVRVSRPEGGRRFAPRERSAPRRIRPAVERHTAEQRRLGAGVLPALPTAGGLPLVAGSRASRRPVRQKAQIRSGARSDGQNADVSATLASVPDGFE